MPCILVQGYLCTLPEVPPNLQPRTDFYFAAEGNISAARILQGCWETRSEQQQMRS